jgi:hypothetical protein
MAVRTRLVDGSLLIRDGGQWREATPLEAMQAGTSPQDAFGLGTAGAITGLGQTLYNAAAGPRPNIGPTPQEQAAAGVAQYQPGMVTAGAVASNLVGVNPVALARGIGRGVGGMAGRVAEAIRGGGAAGVPANGLEMTLGERTGWGPLRRMESGIQSQGGFDALKARRTAIHNRAGGAMIGMPDATVLDGATLGQAADRMGQVYEELLNRPYTLAEKTRASVAALPRQGEDLQALTTRLTETPGEVPGDLIKNLRRQMQERLSAARGTDDLMAQDYERAIKGLLKDIEPQMPPEGLARFQKVNREWKNLNVLESMPELRSTGNITPRQAVNALSAERGYGKTFVRGRLTGDPETDRFMELTRKLAKLPTIADSGTASRMMLPTVGAAITGAQGDNPAGALGGAAAGAAGGYLIPLALGRALTLAP